MSRATTQDVLSQIEGWTSKRQVIQSKALLSLTRKRHFRIHALFHKMTTHLVNHLVANDVKVLIFGHNVGQKQDIQLGSRTNQNFVSLPFIMLMGQLRYKCERVGIRFIETEEAHTSKCSFLDRELVDHHETYVGKRVKRGLFRSAKGILINADVNGSLNIGRKYLSLRGLYSDELHDALVKYMSNPCRITV